MKRFKFFIAIGVLAASTAYSQNAGGTAGSAPSAPSSPSAAGAASAAAANQQGINGGPAQPSPFSQNQPNPNIIRRDQALTASNGLAVATNAFNMNSNQFGIVTNRFQTNVLTSGIATNGQLSPTSRPGFDNRIFSSNNPAAGPYSRTNHLGPASSFGTNASAETGTANSTAISPADRAVLFSVRQAVQTAFAAGIQPSVNYIVNGGVVTLVGLVPTIQEKFAVQTVAQGVPGVNRVVNNIEVNNSAATLSASNGISTASAAAAVGGNTNLTAINSPRTTISNGTPTVATNLTPTGNGASRIYSPNRTGLPPGLQNRETLPPGLQNREQLPAGLSNQTNSTSGNTP